MKSVLQIAGLSRQAVHKHQKQQAAFNVKLSALILDADLLREEHPGCGVEKMYFVLRPDFIGRDKFIDLFMQLGYRIKQNKNYRRTTVPVHSRYQNLIQGMMIQDRNIVWQTDITYFYMNGRYYYLVFIIDVYTKKIVGYHASDHLRAEANLAALRMAIKNTKGSLENLIHHSDRGSQYVDNEYIPI